VTCGAREKLLRKLLTVSRPDNFHNQRHILT